jgi:hypothetical protein
MMWNYKKIYFSWEYTPGLGGRVIASRLGGSIFYLFYLEFASRKQKEINEMIWKSKNISRTPFYSILQNFSPLACFLAPPSLDNQAPFTLFGLFHFSLQWDVEIGPGSVLAISFCFLFANSRKKVKKVTLPSLEAGTRVLIYSQLEIVFFFRITFWTISRKILIRLSSNWKNIHRTILETICQIFGLVACFLNFWPLDLQVRFFPNIFFNISNKNQRNDLKINILLSVRCESQLQRKVQIRNFPMTTKLTQWLWPHHDRVSLSLCQPMQPISNRHRNRWETLGPQHSRQSPGLLHTFSRYYCSSPRRLESSCWTMEWPFDRQLGKVETGKHFLRSYVYILENSRYGREHNCRLAMWILKTTYPKEIV